MPATCRRRPLRLVEHLTRLRDPERIGAWPATTARNESLRILRRSGRQIPVGDSPQLKMPVGSIGPTRGRCLERLRADAALAGITVDAGDSG